jgi:hypothetical protein
MRKFICLKSGKTLLLLAFVSIVAFVSCEKTESLAGTVWKSARIETADGRWSQREMTFGSTQVFYTVRNDDGSTGSDRTWTYTFNPPIITF